MGERRGTKALELWCKRMVEGYPGVKINNMTTSWRDGLAFCAIIHHFRPELIDFSKLSKGDIYYNNELAFRIAEKHLGIPALLEAEDMVEYDVPDKLSILTYLAQFYKAFATPQGSSPSRVVQKRPATAAERGIVSPASTSPPTKMVNRAGGTPRRDPCAKCGLPVFIAERLNVGKALYHRTCFRCARCNSQLTLANYYETDSNQFCCETCPDEEPRQPTAVFVEKAVLSRSLSDEEKSASLKKTSDDYSNIFEATLENTSDPALKKDSTLTKGHNVARSAFLTAQVDTDSDEEMPPELPKTKPPDINKNPSDTSVSSLNKNVNVTESKLEDVQDLKKRETNVDSVVYRTKVSDQQKPAGVFTPSPVISVTKDITSVDSRPISVRDRMKLFEKASASSLENKSYPVREETDAPAQQETEISPLKETLKSSPLKEQSRTSQVKEKSTPSPTKEPPMPSPIKERSRCSTLEHRTSLQTKEKSDKSTPTKQRSDRYSTPKLEKRPSPLKERSQSPIRTFDFRTSTPNIALNDGTNEIKNPSPNKELRHKQQNIEEKSKEKSVSPLNNLLETQINLKKKTSGTTMVQDVHPPLDQKETRRPLSEILMRSSSESYIRKTSIGTREFDNSQEFLKSDVSALKDNLVNVGVEEVKGTKCMDLDNVSEKLVEKDDSQILGDGNLEIPSVESDVTKQRSDIEVEIKEVELSHSNVQSTEKKNVFEQTTVVKDDSIISIETPEVSEILEEISFKSQEAEDSVIIIESSSSVIEISDETIETTPAIPDISDSFNEIKEDYPDDLNPFGEDEDEAMLQQEQVHHISQSSNPFEDDDDDDGPLNETSTGKPIPAGREITKHEEKVGLNPFDEDDDELASQEAEKAVPKPVTRKKLKPLIHNSEEDTPEFLKEVYIDRINYNTDNVKKSAKKIVAAPRFSLLTPFWRESDKDTVGDNKRRLPVPTPRKTRIYTDALDSKLNEGEMSSIFGSNSSLSSINSSVHSARKKKPAPRPPMLSPDHQESGNSSLTSSPNTSVQHSPRLSSSKNRKTKRAPLPPSSIPTTTQNETSDLNSSALHSGNNQEEWEKEKDAKDELNKKRQSEVFSQSDSDPSNQNVYVPNKSTFGKWKRKKGPAPSRPVPQRRSIKQLPMTEIKKELDLIELQQQGLEKQGVRLEEIIRERCEGPSVEDADPIDVEDLILQLFEVVNEKNELCRRQAELMYLRRQQRLEEEHAEVEYEIRCLMMEPEANKTDSDKAREEKLINRLVEIVERRNEIIECLEMDRIRENDEDSSITNSLNDYASKRDEVPNSPDPEAQDKKEKKKKKKIKLRLGKKSDLDKDIDESESSSVSSGKEKKKKKFALF